MTTRNEKNRSSRRALSTVRRLGIYALCVLQLAFPISCSRDSTYHGEAQPGGLFGALASSFNLGERVYTVTKSRLAASPTRAAEKVQALEARRDEFIAAVNAVITPDALQQIGPAVQAFFALVDDGTLPAMALNVAEILDQVANEPTKRTLTALSSLAETRSVIQTDDVLEYGARSINYPEIEQIFAALAALIIANDGVDAQGVPNGERNLCADVQELIAVVLRELSAAPIQGGPAGLFDGLSDELLVEAPRRASATATAGAPSWIVRVDANGNPAVAADAQGKLPAPFIDANGDRVADVGADGLPIDSTGTTIDIPPFGTPGTPGRDADGRALTPGGALLYRYADAKQTLLAHFLALGGESLRRRLDEQAFDVAEIALGARAVRDAGTPADGSDDYIGFAPGGPVPDLAWGGLELLKQPGVLKVLRAVAEMNRADATLGERLLVTIGKICEKLRPLASQPSVGPPQQTWAAVDRAIALGERVFEVRGTSPSVGRLLFDVVNQIGHSARELPRELALMARYRKLIIDANGNPANGSELVDWSQPPTKAGSPQGENRSVLHQLLDLLKNADGCNTFLWAGRPLSETIIELMAGRSVGTVTSLIDFLRNPIVRGLVGLYCSAIRSDLDALDGLAASGALDAFLPLAKAFVDKGETRLLVDILVAVDTDYSTVVRPNEVHLADALGSGAFESIFDLLDLLVAGRNGQAIRDPVSGERAVDIVADLAAKLLDHPTGGISDRRGVKQPTLLHLVVEPGRRIEVAINSASGGVALATGLFYTFTDLGIERVWNDNGTPANPADDFEELANPSVAPFMARLFDLLARNIPQDATTRASRIRSAQDACVAALDGRHFATAFDLGKTLRLSPQTNALRDGLVHLLTPDPVAREDLFGALLKLAATVVETRVDSAPLRDLAAFGADIFDPAARRIVPLVTAFSRVLQADRGKTVITLLRNLMNTPAASAGLPAGTSPAESLVSIFGDIRRAAGATTPATRVADLEHAVREAAAFIRDRDGGLERIFELIRTRPR